MDFVLHAGSLCPVLCVTRKAMEGKWPAYMSEGLCCKLETYLLRKEVTKPLPFHYLLAWCILPPRTSTDYGAVSLGRVKDAFHRKFAYDIDLRSLGALALSHFISENLQSLCYISIGEPIPGTHPPKSDKLLVPVDLDW